MCVWVCRVMGPRRYERVVVGAPERAHIVLDTAAAMAGLLSADEAARLFERVVSRAQVR